MSSLRELIAREDAILAGSARLRSIHADAVRRGREAVVALLAEDLHVDDAETRLEKTYAQALDDYAARAAREITEQDDQAWHTLVDLLKAHSWQELLSTRGAPGAARLLSAMDMAREKPPARVDDALIPASRTCVCGYAKTGNLPKRLCQGCARAIGAAWVAEERALLQRAAGLQADAERILDEAISALAEARLVATEDTVGMVDVALARARRRLARANRRHRSEVSLLDLTRWRRLAELAGRTSMPSMNAVARRARRRLGMAQLTSLALRGNTEVEARMSSRARERGKP